MKAEMKITITRIIELDPSAYNNASTPEEILKQEIQFAEDLPHEWMDSEDTVWTTSARLLPEDSGEEAQ